VIKLGKNSPLKTTSLLLSVVVCMSLLLTMGGAGTAAVSSRAAASPTMTVAKNPLGAARSSFTGQTTTGQAVTGYFTPLSFARRNGNLVARGLVNGVVQQAGTNTTFAMLRTVKVASINGADPSARQAEAQAVCRILRLRLGPIRLNLLGLRVVTNRIKVNIVAIPGPGNLLGNLLCAIAHLLDGPPTPAQLRELQNLLNQILGRLNLG
jgi:hypothetical protein